MLESTTTSNKHSMNIWTVVLAVNTIVWCIPGVTSQEQPAFFLGVTVSRATAFFNFTDAMFQKFYHCLRNRNNDQCEIQRDNYDKVIVVKGCLPVGMTQTTDESTCKPLTPGIMCKRGSFSDVSQILSCPDAKFYEIRNDADLSTTARTTWLGFENMVMVSHISGITVQGLSVPSPKSFKFAIKGSFTTTLLPPPPPTSTATKRITTSTSIPSGSPTTPATNYTGSDDEGDDDMGIIIGACVGGAVVVVIILMIVVILWRRRKKSSASPATSKNNQCEDTDVYAYGESIRPTNNVNPELNTNNLNHNPHERKPEVYATVDPSKKLSRIASSDAINANVNVPKELQEKRPHFSLSLDYTDVDIADGAVHNQHSSDDNNGQEIPISGTPPPLPPDPSAKLNVYSETGEGPREAYSQVVKKNKTEKESAFNWDGADSNPARDASGYEEAVSCTDTKYTNIKDSSAMNTVKPAPDGVYAKLHDPLRNITDVYNEALVEENTGE